MGGGIVSIAHIIEKWCIMEELFNRKCFHCKSNIILRRNGANANVVFFDNHFYDEQCFIDMSGIKKKCAYCKKDIIINSPDDNVIYYDGRYYDINCFIEKCSSMKTPKWKTALQYIETYKEDARIQIEKLFKSKKADLTNIDKYKKDAQKNIKRIFAESDVNAFLREQYNVVNVPWYQISQVYSGKYKNLTRPIPPEDLLDMWRQKINTLNKIAQRNKQKGNEITGDKRIVYDLAILVNKYDGYLMWKEKQKIALVEQEEKKEQKQDTINYENINTTIRQPLKNKGGININEILDEI